MRLRSLSLATLLVGTSLLAQTTNPNPQPKTTAPITKPTSNTPANNNPNPSPEDKKLDALLNQWEERMTKIDKLLCELKRQDKDALNPKRNREFTGRAMFMKPNLASLDLNMVGDTKGDSRELYVSNGNNLYEYQMRNKKVLIHELPKNGGFAEDSLLSFIFGMKAVDAKRRYEMTLHTPKQNADWYHYVRITPRTQADKQEFVGAELVLFAKPAEYAFMPARLWFKQPNDNEITWTFAKYDTSAKLDKTTFTPPQFPKDWQVERANANPPEMKKQPDPKSVVPGPPPSKIRSSGDK